MDPLAEPQAVALLMNNDTGYVYVYADGSSRWAETPPDPRLHWNPSDVPEGIACRKRTYHQARGAFAHAIKRLRSRGVPVG